MNERSHVSHTFIVPNGRFSRGEEFDVTAKVLKPSQRSKFTKRKDVDGTAKVFKPSNTVTTMAFEI